MKSGSLYQKKCANLPRPWIKRLGCALGTVAAVAVSSHAFAACEYTIVNDWGSGFTASITITNSTAAPITGWNIAWEYANSDRMSNGWNAKFSGTNPYTASDFGWNGALQPNQSVTIGFQGTKSGAAEIPVITGAVCIGGEPQSSAATSSISASETSAAPASSQTTSQLSSEAFSSISSSALSSMDGSVSSAASSVVSSQAASLVWALDTAQSLVNFVTISDINTITLHKFTELSGSIDADQAHLQIHLDSLLSDSELRDAHVRQQVFKTAHYPVADVTVSLDSAEIAGIAVGDSSTFIINANLSLHGVTQVLSTEVTASRLSPTRVLVQSRKPMLLNAADFGFADGINALLTVAQVSSISQAVPVDFALIFDAQ